jgi:acetolactate synthase-1/2/3 large subunit
MTAAELLVEALKLRGVEWMATLCGHGLDPLLDAAHRGGLRLIDARNEQTAAYAADAFGRLTRRPGVCAVSSGLALVNALSGAGNAWFDRAPLLLISGAGPTTTAGKGHFQDLDQAGLARPLTKFSASIDSAANTLGMLNQAFAAAITDPPGPAHLMFPLDVQESEAGDSLSSKDVPRGGAVEQDPAETACTLASSKAPLVVAGSGIFYNGSGAAMLRFCEKASMPVITPIWDRGVVDRPSPVFLGVVGAATGGPAVLGDADCILMAGAETDYRVGYLKPPAVRPDARICRFRGDWSGLAERAPAQRWESWLAACVERREDFRCSVERRAEEQARPGLHALDIIRAIRQILPEDPVLLIDGGSIGQWAHQLLCRDRYPGDWLTCGRSGVVGWGIGGAMGARLACPNRPVVLLAGDGAFTFNVADLECAVRQCLPFVAVIADDQGWGITRLGHIERFGAARASSLGPIAFDRLAESLGARGVRASTPEEITGELRCAIELPAVTVIHVPITGGNP